MSRAVPPGGGAECGGGGREGGGEGGSHSFPLFPPSRSPPPTFPAAPPRDRVWTVPSPKKRRGRPGHGDPRAPWGQQAAQRVSHSPRPTGRRAFPRAAAALGSDSGGPQCLPSLLPSLCRGGELPRSEPARRCPCPAVLGAARPRGAGGRRAWARGHGGASWGVERSGGVKGVCLAFPRWKGRPDPAAVANPPSAGPERLAGGVRFGGVFLAEGRLGWPGAPRPGGAAGSRHLQLPFRAAAGDLEPWCWERRAPRSRETGVLRVSGGIRRRRGPGSPRASLLAPVPA